MLSYLPILLSFKKFYQFQFFRMFTPPYGALDKESYDQRIMNELELAWLTEDDSATDKTKTTNSENQTLKFAKPKKVANKMLLKNRKYSAISK